MTDEQTSIAVTFLRRIEAHTDETQADMAELKQRIELLGSGYASLSRRLDRIGGNVEQIKLRLGLASSAAD
jgi:hypothetical protein